MGAWEVVVKVGLAHVGYYSGDCYDPWVFCLNYWVLYGSSEQNNEAISIVGYVIKKFSYLDQHYKMNCNA